MVLVPIMVGDGGLSLLLTQRAFNLSHHRGEVAFPGGMWEPGDQFPVSTALREADEEVALNAKYVDVKGLLPSMPTRAGTLVTPVVATVSSAASLEASPDEIESIFCMPMAELLADRRIRTDIFNRDGQSLWIPAYQYQGYEIWGLTAGVIKMLLGSCFNRVLTRQHSAPEKVW